MAAIPRKTPARPAGEIVKPGNIEIADSEDARVTRVGAGWASVEEPAATDLTYIQSKTAGDYVEFEFYGTAIWLRFIAGIDRGQADVSIDDGTPKTLDMYDEYFRPRMSWVASNLAPNTKHKVKVEVKGTASVYAMDCYVSVDAFVVELSPGALQTWSMIEEALLVKTSEWLKGVRPLWYYGAEATAPAADSNLVEITVAANRWGIIYGFLITAQEENDFTINWVGGAPTLKIVYSRRIVFSGKGTLMYLNSLAFNEGAAALAGELITIKNVNAGGSGKIYEAALLYAEI